MFSRLWRVFEGFFALFVRGLEKSSPKALLEAEIVAFERTAAQYNHNLARQAGLIERLKGQVLRQSKQVEVLTDRAKACYNADQMAEAGRYALDVKAIRADLMENEEQMAQAEDLYRSLTRQRDVFVKEACRRIDAIQSRMPKAEVAELRATLDVAGADAAPESPVAPVEARVSHDSMQSAVWAMNEEDQRVREMAALQELAASIGLAPKT